MAQKHHNKNVAQLSQAENTTCLFFTLPPELRQKIYADYFANEKRSVTSTSELPLFRVSREVRAEARQAFIREAELTVFVGSNIADRAAVINLPQSRYGFGLVHVQKSRTSTGLFNIGHLSHSFLYPLDPGTAFRRVRFQIYSEEGISHMLRKGPHDQDSLMIASLSYEWSNHFGGRLSTDYEFGESHPAVYKPKPTMRPQPPLLYQTCCVAAAMTDANNKTSQVVFGNDNFKGFTMRDLEDIAAAFRYLTPRDRFRDAVIRVIALRQLQVERSRKMEQNAIARGEI